MKSIILFLAVIFSLSKLHAQCPTDEADLSNGGTFSGNCTVDVGGAITITGAVTWTSGRLTINDTGGGGDGDLFINSGGSITIQNMAILDLDDGDVTINTGGTLNIASGGVLEIAVNNRDLTLNGGTLNSAGAISVNDNLSIANGGTLNMTGGTLSVNDDLTVDGSGSSLNLSNDASISDVNNLSFTNGATGDMGVGTSIIIQNNLTLNDATLTIAGYFETTSTGNNADITLIGVSNLNIEAGAEVIINDDIDFGTGDGTSTITVNGGSFSIGDDLKFNGGTDNDAIVVNGGSLSVTNNIDIDPGSSITLNGGALTSGTINNQVPATSGDFPAEIILNGGDASSGGVTLPVTLVSFDGNRDAKKNAIILKWTTATEINNHGFYIERSNNTGTFESIGFVEGHGTSKNTINYTFQDTPLGSGNIYYRLRQVDYDGTSTLSQVISISSTSLIKIKIDIYPNPTFGNLQLSGPTNEPFGYTLYDQSGKIVTDSSTEYTSLRSISDTISTILNESGVPGVYILAISNSLYNQHIRIVKK